MKMNDLNLCNFMLEQAEKRCSELNTELWKYKMSDANQLLKKITELNKELEFYKAQNLELENDFHDLKWQLINYQLSHQIETVYGGDIDQFNKEQRRIYLSKDAAETAEFKADMNKYGVSSERYNK